MDAFRLGAALALLMVMGCAGHVGSTLAAKAAVQYAVVDYIADDMEAAQRVHDTSARMAKLVSDSAEGRVEVLKQVMLTQIDFARLSPADQIVIRNLIDAIAIEIAARQDSGRLDGDTVVAVEAVLAWAREAAIAAGAMPCSVVLGNC